MFHVALHPPRQDGRCDRCGGELVQRDDDREETIARRMEIYERQTAPLLDYYGRASILREVSGLGTREEVYDRVAASVR
jgi:adenylate kinase